MSNCLKSELKNIKRRATGKRKQCTQVGGLTVNLNSHSSTSHSFMSVHEQLKALTEKWLVPVLLASTAFLSRFDLTWLWLKFKGCWISVSAEQCWIVDRKVRHAADTIAPRIYFYAYVLMHVNVLSSERITSVEQCRPALCPVYSTTHEQIGQSESAGCEKYSYTHIHTYSFCSSVLCIFFLTVLQTLLTLSRQPLVSHKFLENTDVSSFFCHKSWHIWREKKRHFLFECLFNCWYYRWELSNA